MIKYLELTAPEKSEYRQAKIVSVEIQEGDRVEIGDTLFRVKSGSTEIDLPATKAGRIVEIIVLQDENISVMTPLVLLETEVAESTATLPITEPAEDPAQDAVDDAAKAERRKAKIDKKAAKKQKKAKKAKAAEVTSSDKEQLSQQSLNLSGNDTVQAASTTTPGKQSIDEKTTSESEPANAESNAAENRVNESKTVENSIVETNVIETKTASDKQVNTIQIKVPDIGGDSAKVVELLVAVGDTVAIDDPILTLESDKASMDVPSTHSGVVASIAVEVEQDVSEGTVLLEIDASSPANTQAGNDVASNDVASNDVASTDVVSADPAPAVVDKPASSGQNTDSPGELVDVMVPDIGGESAKVIEILVSVGQSVELEDALITLESDKASMDVPSSATGIVQSITVDLDDEVNEGTLILSLRAEASASPASDPIETTTTPTAPAPSAQPAPANSEVPTATPQAPPLSEAADTGKSHASPSIRRFARELGVQLSGLQGSGRKGRISKSDVKQFVKAALSAGPTSAASAPGPQGSGIPPIPAVDFSRFGETETQPLNKIKRLTATNLHRSWLNVPHVTHNDEANISDLDSFRKQLNEEFARQGKPTKLSPLAFIVKAVIRALQNYPQFNSSLDATGENLIIKKYYNIGIAVETPNGLVVPVIKDADAMSVSQIAEAMGELAAKARDKKLSMADMSGACFTISSLGGIGGTDFTPIVNAPEVAILGVSRSKIQPHWNGSEFEPATMLPLSLSYDHRVIDGAEAARFCRHIATVLEDVRRLTV